MNNKPTISVVMITYNHKLYLEEAIYGVLMQECDVDFELIIADDCSPDNTRSIIQKICNTHDMGHCIKYTRHESNKGVANNFAWAMEQSLGKYIALCEGDDFWVDPNKLQKQYDFLTANSEFTMCSHSTNEVDGKGKVFKVSTRRDQVIDLSKVLEQGWFIRTATMFFRREVIDDGIPSFFYSAYSTDYILQVMILRRGKCQYFPEIMSAYRSHDQGFSNISTELLLKRQQKIAPLLDVLDKYTNSKFTAEIRKHQKRIKQDLSVNLVRYPSLILTLGVMFYLKNFHLWLFLEFVVKRFYDKFKNN